MILLEGLLDWFLVSFTSITSSSASTMGKKGKMNNFHLINFHWLTSPCLSSKTITRWKITKCWAHQIHWEGGWNQCLVLFINQSIYLLMHNVIINMKHKEHTPSTIGKPVVLHGNKKWRKPQNDFLILKQDYIHLHYQYQLEGSTNWKEAPTPYIYQQQLEWNTNSLYLLAPTGRRNPLPRFTKTNWKEATTP